MKNTKAFLSVAALLAMSLTFTACSKSDNPITVAPTVQYTANLNGANEKPTSTTSPATGNFVGVLNTTTRVMSYTVTYTGFPTSSTVNGGHLHRITNADGTGPIDIPFPSLASPIIATTPVLAQSKIDSMNNGQYYVNIHTVALPAGAIRGDVRRQ